MFAQGALFRLRVQDLFRTFQEHFQGSGVEILEPRGTGSGFLIGDTPALTVDLATGNAGVRGQRIALGAANTVMLPLTPRLLVALGPVTATAQVPHEFVEHVNHVQVQAVATVRSPPPHRWLRCLHPRMAHHVRAAFHRAPFSLAQVTSRARFSALLAQATCNTDLADPITSLLDQLRADDASA